MTRTHWLLTIILFSAISFSFGYERGAAEAYEQFKASEGEAICTTDADCVEKFGCTADLCDDEEGD